MHSYRTSAGYSWLTNQHGLTLDTVTAYELVLPNGTITTVTSNEEDLFFALKVRCPLCRNYSFKLTPRTGWIQQFCEHGPRSQSICYQFYVLANPSYSKGIVTEFTLQTFPQGQVWGGLMTFTGDHFEAIATATANFAQNNTDPKAAIITEFNTVVGLV